MSCKIFTQNFWKNSKHFSTISALYNFIEEILKDDEALRCRNIKPSEDVIEEKYNYVSRIIVEIAHSVDLVKTYVNIIKNEKDNPGRKIGHIREQKLLFKPITHMAMGLAIHDAVEKGIDIKAIVQKLNKIDWTFSNTIWDNILVSPNGRRVLSGKETIRNAGKLISYLIVGEKFSIKDREEIKNILERVNGEAKALPDYIK